jgi:hypothetical protein
MGRGPRTFKKKPVLVLDADELQQAHLAIVLGGSQIMEEAGEPQAAPRPRQPAMMLGLAPIGADEDWQPPAFVPRADDDYAFAEEQSDVWEALPEPELESEPELEAADDLADWDAFDDVPVEELPAMPEAVAERDDDWAMPEAVVEQDDDDDDWAMAAPSIEEQLARMRQLTQPGESARAHVPDLPLATEPEPELAPELAPELWFEPEPVAFHVPEHEPEPEPVFEPEPEPELAFEPVMPPEEPVYDLPLAAVMTDEPAALELAPAPVTDDDHYHDGPDLTWLQPKERRQLVFSESPQSQLRARLIQHPPEPEPEAPPSLWERLRGWFAGLRG